MPPRVLVLRAPGTNCDAETAFAFQRAGAEADVVHLNRWLQQPALAEQFQILCIPGGFSYGDDVAAGRIFANQLRHHLADRLTAFRDEGKLVLGICNGFQVLVKTGLMDADGAGQSATLAWNSGGRFQDRWVPLRTEGALCPFLAGIERLQLPIAHAEGQFAARDEATLDRLEAAGQLALRHDGPEHNPNGAQRDVAGMCDAPGRGF
ncbi:MAG TPA: phosphoribosylformylglycinamidine synthase subunit PurQ, partial [Lacipirellulaceae bacterium]|nr:phosphoribosylformylglycinamidine synthase subunit PurQ [Lacipirellulaceae bacterium]